jgi:hypothetical protein
MPRIGAHRQKTPGLQKRNARVQRRDCGFNPGRDRLVAARKPAQIECRSVDRLFHKFPDALVPGDGGTTRRVVAGDVELRVPPLVRQLGERKIVSEVKKTFEAEAAILRELATLV